MASEAEASGAEAPGPPPEDEGASALPSVAARLLAFGAIVLAGICGALIGYAFTDLQCEGDCTAATGASAIVGAAIAAGGVAVVAVLALRAMGEWQTFQDHSDEQGASG